MKKYWGSDSNLVGRDEEVGWARGTRAELERGVRERSWREVGMYSQVFTRGA
jgi:hypothetical protein